ncbi:hypothetical protein DES49_1596 [Halospina denitrificans]|uniref:Uncharacterized protein n=1 Tax=Halospina denitrificans TaxID=332522 RepID=A0A4R7JT64_9GAMM|nr:hypothetical protein DES49_1596 [Halospina denitrificans]
MRDIDETQEKGDSCNPAEILEAAKELNVPEHHIRPLSWYVTGFCLHNKAERHGPAHRFYLMAEREAEAIAVIYG